MIRATMKAAIGFCALLAMSTAAEAARYIRVNFTTNAARYYTLNDAAPVTVYAQAWSGEMLIDTQAIAAGEDFSSIADQSGSGDTLVRYSDHDLLIEQVPAPEGRSLYASFTPVSLADATFDGTLSSGEFNDTYITHGRYELTDTTSTNLLSLKVSGFDSDEQLASYVRWTPLAAAVPEPASWALMISGFGLVGTALRRRRATSAALAA